MESQPLQGFEILLLDDDNLLRRRLSSYLVEFGAEVSEAKNLAEAKNLLETFHFDLGLIDVHLPDGLGLELLEHHLFSEDATVIVMTAEGGVDGAVKAISLGAADYLVKPFEPDELPLVFKRGREKLKEGRIKEFEKASEKPTNDGLVFGSGLSTIQSMVQKILQADANLANQLPPVLIEGETGTGKTTLARWIHNQGPRKQAQLVEVNAATLPEKLAEAELFGYEKGAFTDAKSARMGLFEAASGGTLFIDELASLPLSIQAKILTAIEDHKIRRVGGTKEIKVDARIIAASNRPLSEAVSAGEFREDLRHRLNLFSIRIPPLRERKNDIEDLISKLLPGIVKKHRKEHSNVSEEGLDRLKNYSWPGNVRELIHELERALIFEDDPNGLAFSHLSHSENKSEIHSDSKAMESVETKQGSPVHWLEDTYQIPEEGFSLEDAINKLIQKALDQKGGNVSAAARLLGVNRDYIRYRFDKKKKN